MPDRNPSDGKRQSCVPAALLALCVACAAPAWQEAPGAAASAPSTDANELARQSTDPTASLMALNFVADYTGGFHGPSDGRPDDSTEIDFRPVIPFRAGDLDNIIRRTLPYNVDGRDEEGLENVTMLNLVVLNEDWGR